MTILILQHHLIFKFANLVKSKKFEKSDKVTCWRDFFTAMKKRISIGKCNDSKCYEMFYDNLTEK